MDTKCLGIMLENPVVLKPTMTLNEVLETAGKIGTRYLPVVDDNGDYLGVFSTMTLIKLLLPSSVSITDDVAGGQWNFDLDFMQTSTHDLKSKMKTIGEQTIAEHILTDKVPTCTPETTIMEALHLLYKYHYHTVVLEKGSKRFLGVITIHGVLERIKG